MMLKQGVQDVMRIVITGMCHANGSECISGHSTGMNWHALQGVTTHSKVWKA
jgi:hypothetical protein